MTSVDWAKILSEKQSELAAYMAARRAANGYAMDCSSPAKLLERIDFEGFVPLADPAGWLRVDVDPDIRYFERAGEYQILVMREGESQAYWLRAKDLGI